jgi:hypothetical protein
MAQAQRAVVSADKAKGAISINDEGPIPVKVNYTLTPAYPDNLTLLVSSQGEFSLNARIVNAKGEEVQAIDQAKVTGRYASSINVASLQPGAYFIEVKTSAAGGNMYRVPFEIAKQ